MSKIYVITGSCGEYSAHNTWNICAFRFETRANEITDKLNKLATFRTKFKKRFYDEFEVPYKELDPSVNFIKKPGMSKEFSDAQQAHSIHKTETTKKNVKRLQEEHLAKIEEVNAHNAKVNAAYKIMNDAGEEWKKNNCIIPDDLKEVVGLDDCDSYDVRYDYCELNVLD